MYLFVAEESPFGSEEILQKDVWKKKDVCVFNTHIYIYIYYRYIYTNMHVYNPCRQTYVYTLYVDLPQGAKWFLKGVN